MNINNVKSEFPILQEKLKGKPLIYLDSANSSQKPKVVIDRMSNFYETEFSNVGRSVHTLAVKATNRFEDSRDKVKNYLNAKISEKDGFVRHSSKSLAFLLKRAGFKKIKILVDAYDNSMKINNIVLKATK